MSFNCTAGPASDGKFTVTWMKDGEEHPASAQHLMTDSQGNYSITSKVCIRLLLQDLLSEMTCEVAHPALAEPLRRTFNLSQVLQGNGVGETLFPTLLAREVQNPDPIWQLGFHNQWPYSH